MTNGADRPLCSPIHQVAHLIHKASRGRHAVRWISRGHEASWQADHRTVHFAPADGEQTIALTSALPDYAGQVICIPQGHLHSISASEGMASGGASRRILSHELLKQPSRSIAQVAGGLRFSSQSHFTRLFSDLTGLTPTKYRKQFTPIVG